MLAASALLGWLVAHTDVFFADGLRYIAQARAIDRGAWTQGLVGAVDHPIYPISIAATHYLVGGKAPRDWQAAAQLAAAVAGVLLVIPIYLISAEVFGSSSAWLACCLIYLLPFNGHVLADALSESTYLLFWSWGLWSALRFLRSGRLVWLPPVIAFSVLAYLTRPEGLILPFALLIALVALSWDRSPSIPAPNRWWAIAVLVAGPVVAAGPFMLMKGGISTKPSMMRILGLAKPAPAMAVERERPLDPAQSGAKTVVLATRAMLRAVVGATSLPLLVLALMGASSIWSSPIGRRFGVLLATIVLLCTLAMVRLHAMSGYCTPRHAMVVSWILIPASAVGLRRLSAAIGQTLKRIVGQLTSTRTLETAIRCLILACCVLRWAPAAIAKIDPGLGGYRQAGDWLAAAAQAGEALIDPKGFSIFYADKPGYSFATLGQGLHDPSVRWVVAHEALVYGPWDYSNAIRALVGNRRPIRIFPAKAARGVSKVYVYDLLQPGDKTAVTAIPQSRSRR
jgi:hypothetical protein